MTLRRGIVSLPADSELVNDADEEVCIRTAAIYHIHCTKTNRRFFCSTRIYNMPPAKTRSQITFGAWDTSIHARTLSITFELKSGALESDPSVKQSKRKRRNGDITKTLEVELAQDKTALRSRKGDTGSVLWRARCVVY
jgi:hypothetical protein